MISCYMLDVHIANRCNLNCDGCNHWSNYGFKEVFSKNTLYQWAKPWAKIIKPERVNLLITILIENYLKVLFSKQPIKWC